MEHPTFFVDEQIPQISISYHSKLSTIGRFRAINHLEIIELVYEMWDKDTIEAFEEFKVVYLGSGNVVKGIHSHSKGTIQGTTVDPRIIFAIALKTLSTGLILVHSHPSGSTKPSQADLNVTAKIKKACQFLEIVLLDHFILAPDGSYYSFMKEGLI